MSVFDEAATVQAAVVERLSQSDMGWRHVPGKSLAREKDNLFLEAELVSAIQRLNPEIGEDPARADEIVPRLRATYLATLYNDGLLAANELMTTWLRGHQTHKYVGTDDYVPVRLIDFDDPRSNSLIVSDEVTFGHGGEPDRFDIVLWVNGIPVVVGETKTATDHNKSWLNGALDITEAYEIDSAPFFVPNVLSFATEGREFHYGGVGQPPEHWLMWGATTDPIAMTGPERVMRSVELLLSPEQLLSVLRDFVLFDRPVVGGKATYQKLVPRYPQVEGVEAIHERVLDPERTQGLLWHYQGTGKTLLMAFAALRLLNDEEVGGPTVVIVLDRLDLVEQTVRQFQTVGLPRLQVAGTKKKLQELLAEDKRGVIVTTIFRFAGAGHLNDRDNIVVLVDEAHRTQQGVLGDDMRSALPNAQFFGLTGTPIADSQRNTFKLFGDASDPGWVINRYTMERAITDGASVPVHVESRLVDFHVASAELDEAFAEFAKEEGLTEEEVELLADKATSVRTFMANPTRIRAVCEDIVEHYFSKVEPLGMKAQVVAFDRSLCVAYHDEITRLLAKRSASATAEVVMTVGTSKHEPKEWKRFELSREDEAKVKGRFLDSTDPLSFLIVTAKLLTGFDAPLEGVMYLDKPLRFHTLFQAITRTNRRWTNPANHQEKLYGLVVDYVGLGNEIAKALQAADPEKGGKRPVDTEGLLGEFAEHFEVVLARFDGIDRADASFAALQAAQERIPPGSERDGFAADFMRIQGLWEFLFPNPDLEAFREDYRWLAQVYESVQPTAVSDALLWHRLGAKTLALVHEHVTNVRVTGTGLDEVIMDAETVEAIRQLALPDTEVPLDGPMTVGEALDTIEARISRKLDDSGGHSAYVALSERLERLRRAQLERAEASIEFLRELLELAREVTAAENAEQEGTLGLLPDPNIGALTQILNEYKPDDTPVIVEEVVGDIDGIVRQVRFTGWQTSQPGDRAVRIEIRKVMKKYALPTAGELFDRAYAYIRENY